MIKKNKMIVFRDKKIRNLKQGVELSTNCRQLMMRCETLNKRYVRIVPHPFYGNKNGKTGGNK